MDYCALGSKTALAHQVAIHTLWNIRIVVLAKPEHENRISHICTDNVKTGIANTLGEWEGSRDLIRAHLIQATWDVPR